MWCIFLFSSHYPLAENKSKSDSPLDTPVDSPVRHRIELGRSLHLDRSGLWAIISLLLSVNHQSNNVICLTNVCLFLLICNKCEGNGVFQGEFIMTMSGSKLQKFKTWVSMNPHFMKLWLFTMSSANILPCLCLFTQSCPILIVIGSIILYFLKFTFIWKAEDQRKRQRNKEENGKMPHPLPHTPSVHKSYVGSGWSLESKAQSVGVRSPAA